MGYPHPSGVRCTTAGVAAGSSATKLGTARRMRVYWVMLITHGDERLAVAAAGKRGQERVRLDLARDQIAIGSAAVGFLQDSSLSRNPRVLSNITEDTNGDGALSDTCQALHAPCHRVSCAVIDASALTVALAKLNAKPVKSSCWRWSASWSSGSKGLKLNVNGCALAAVTATSATRTRPICVLQRRRAACQSFERYSSSQQVNLPTGHILDVPLRVPSHAHNHNEIA